MVKEKASAILESVTNEAAAGAAKWAWLRLGLQQLRQDQPSLSIASYQSALRAAPKDRCSVKLSRLTCSLLENP